MDEGPRILTAGTVMVDVLAVGLPAVAEPGAVIYTPREIETRIGGHPIDVAIDLIKLGMDPAEVGVVAALGVGPYAAFARDVMQRYQVTAYLQEVPDHDTGRNLVLEVAGEDRRFHIDPGANWLLEPGHLAGVLTGSQPQVLSVRPGYSGIDLGLAGLLAPLGDTLVLLDVMEPHPARPPDFLVPVFGHVDVVHCNPREAQAVTGTATVEQAVDEFLRHGVRLVLVTEGAKGARAITPALEVVQPGYRVEAVDATGCGDAFCAGVIYHLAQQHPVVSVESVQSPSPDELARLLSMAQAVGAAAATEPGCVEGVSQHLVARLRAEQEEGVLAATDTRRRS